MAALPNRPAPVENEPDEGYVLPVPIPCGRDALEMATRLNAGPRKAWKPVALGGAESPRFLLANGRLSAGDPSGTWRARDSHTDAFRAKAKAESWFAQYVRTETGRLLAMTPERKAKKDREHAIALADSHRIAKRLEANGIQGYRSDKWDVWVYLVHSGEVVKLPKFVRSAFIPTMAAAIRADNLRALEYFGDCNPWLRFWTLTHGPRTPLSRLRSELKLFHERIRRLNAEDFMRDAGVRIVFRSTELGTVEGLTRNEAGRLMEAGQIEYDEETGEPLFHIHAHCVVKLENGKMENGAWKEFLKTLRAYWGTWMDDDSVIRDMRECVKYVTKPRDIHALSDAQLVELYHAVQGLKLVQPLGELREQIKARREAEVPKILVKVDTPDGRVWAERPNPNARLGRSPAELEASADAALVEKVKTDFGGGDGLPSGVVASCNVVARCMPRFNSAGVKEPAVVVCGNVWQGLSVATHPLVVRMKAQTSDEYAAGLVQLKSIRVHTGTSTVRNEDGDRAFPDRLESWRPTVEVSGIGSGAFWEAGR